MEISCFSLEADFYDDSMETFNYATLKRSWYLQDKAAEKEHYK